MIYLYDYDAFSQAVTLDAILQDRTAEILALKVLSSFPSLLFLNNLFHDLKQRANVKPLQLG